VLHENTRDLKEAERDGMSSMTSRPVSKGDGWGPGGPAGLSKAAWHRGPKKSSSCSRLLKQRRPVVEPDQQYAIHSLGANVWTIVAHFGFMQKPDVPSIFARGQPPIRSCSISILSLANIEIG